MAKGSFTAGERAIWNSIYGTSRGPSSGRLKIMVEEFERRGLVPAMMRVGDEMIPYDTTVFHTHLQDALDHKDDDQVQVYYHPAECKKVIGSSATTWVQWGRCILEVEGLSPKGDDNHPIITENVPRLQLPVAVRDALVSRGIRSASVCRLVSARVVAFFVAAQYESWATPSQVAQVTPFKESLRKLGFEVRDVIVRKDAGVDEVLGELNANPASPPILVVDHGSNGSGEVVSDIAPATNVADALVDDIEAEIRAAEARLVELRARKALAADRAFRWNCAVVVETHWDRTSRGDVPDALLVRLSDGTTLSFGVAGITSEGWERLPPSWRSISA
jgi:hypothetical protein